MVHIAVVHWGARLVRVVLIVADKYKGAFALISSKGAESEKPPYRRVLQHGCGASTAVYKDGRVRGAMEKNVLVNCHLSPTAEVELQKPDKGCGCSRSVSNGVDKEIGRNDRGKFRRRSVDVNKRMPAEWRKDRVVGDAVEGHS